MPSSTKGKDMKGGIRDTSLLSSLSPFDDQLEMQRSNGGDVQLDQLELIGTSGLGSRPSSASPSLDPARVRPPASDAGELPSGRRPARRSEWFSGKLSPQGEQETSSPLPHLRPLVDCTRSSVPASSSFQLSFQNLSRDTMSPKDKRHHRGCAASSAFLPHNPKGKHKKQHNFEYQPFMSMFSAGQASFLYIRRRATKPKRTNKDHPHLIRQEKNYTNPSAKIKRIYNYKTKFAKNQPPLTCKSSTLRLPNLCPSL